MGFFVFLIAVVQNLTWFLVVVLVVGLLVWYGIWMRQPFRIRVKIVGGEEVLVPSNREHVREDMEHIVVNGVGIKTTFYPSHQIHSVTAEKVYR